MEVHQKDSSKCNAILKTNPSPFTILRETIHNHASKDQTTIVIDQQMHVCTEVVKRNINKPVKQFF